MHPRSEACCDDMYFNMKKERGRNGRGWGVVGGGGGLKVQQLSAVRRCAAPFMLQSGRCTLVLLKVDYIFF